MTVSDFSLFYKAVHGYAPFRWQEDLLREVMETGWPDVIGLPTSAGKTSAIDIAIFHLAAEAGMAERRAALRTFFVIDRRVVVDEAAEHALRISRALEGADTGILKDVADALRSYKSAVPLAVSAMRGGTYRDNGWVDEPNQPLVCVSTVDQFGSRLLFRGYQIGEGSRPVHAGLVANDSLLIVDEAHLSTPFLDTVKALNAEIRKGRGARPLRLVEMSATPKAAQRRVFEPEQQTLEVDERLRKRLTASKLCVLRVPKKKFEDEMVTAAKELSGAEGVHVVGVIANTIASARAIFEELGTNKSAEAVLLIGRNRPYCSRALWSRYRDRIAANENRQSEGLLFVVATQTVEVGANLDFDALITESAPLDALRQRFGRLNRLGRPFDAKAALVLRPKGDPVYGEATERTWKFLSGLPQVDFGVFAMKGTLSGRDVEEFASSKDRGPLLFPAHLDTWVQTSPTPDPDPDVAPFLHGKSALDTADVQIIWRGDLDENDSDSWKEKVALSPPSADEALAMPIRGVRRWLKDEALVEVSDIEGKGDAATDEETRKPGRRALRWRGAASEKTEPVQAREVRPGDTLIVPASYRGADEYGWNPAFDETRDVGDDAYNARAGDGVKRPRVRLALLPKERSELLDVLLRRYLGSDDEDADDSALDEINSLLGTGFIGKPRVSGPDSKGRSDREQRVLTWPRQPRKDRATTLPLPDETDEDDDSSFTGADVSLDQHTEGVERLVRRYATGCGLGTELVDDLTLAARLHDLGKADDRFQAWLAGKPFAGTRLLAKSRGERSKPENQRLRALAGYPKNARHEAGSVLAAGALGGLAAAHDAELVGYLIGVHHGYGRPLFPVWEGDPDFRFTVKVGDRAAEIADGAGLARIDSGWIERFWALNRRYGYWFLPYLESILRRADCMRSRQEENEQVGRQTEVGR